MINFNKHNSGVCELDEMRSLYPRVSDIIGKQTEREMRAIPVEALANAAIRGTAIHAYCTAYLKGLWIPEVEEEYKPYLDAFIQWADQNVEKTLYTTTRLYDDEKQFTGEFDCIVTLKDSKETALIDIKTSANVSRSWPIQLAAYKHLCNINGYYFDSVLNVHLKKTKAAILTEDRKLVSAAKVKASIIVHEKLNPYWNIFDSALSCYDYFERKEDLK